jgi:RND family efflux transporter MFP subunit
VKHTTFLSALVSMIIGATAGCTDKAADKQPLTPVRVESVAPRNASKTFRFSATVNPHTQVDLAYKVNGYIREILPVKGSDGRARILQPGDFVSKRKVLARIHDTDYVAKKVEAESQVKEARAALEKGLEDYNRAKILYASKSITAPTFEKDRKEYQVAQAQVTGALAKLDQAKLNLAYCALTSPMDGVILERKIEVGSLVGPGTVAFVLADISSVKVLFGVPDVLLRDVRMGQKLAVSTESSGNARFVGIVTQLAPAANTRTRIFNVEISVPNHESRLKPGMIATLDLTRYEGNGTAVMAPLSSIVRSLSDPSGYAVFVVDRRSGKNIARILDVRLGSVYGNMVEVRDGLKAQEEIVVTGAQLIRNGEEVRIIP